MFTQIRSWNFSLRKCLVTQVSCSPLNLILVAQLARLTGPGPNATGDVKNDVRVSNFNNIHLKFRHHMLSKIWQLWRSPCPSTWAESNQLFLYFRKNKKKTVVTRVTFSICARGPASLASKEQPLSSNSLFWRESPGPRALPESVNPFNELNGPLTKFSKQVTLYSFIINYLQLNNYKIIKEEKPRSFCDDAEQEEAKIIFK